MAMSARDVLETLQTTKTQADLHHLLPQMLKPCVAVMLEDGPPGGECDPNTTCYIIATEFRRLGKPEEDARGALLAWAANVGRGRRLGTREVEKTVVSAYRDELRTYGCSPTGKLYRSGCCVGQENCLYYKACGGRGEHDELSFYRYGWPALVGSAQAALYNAIRALEYERGVPGGKTYASYRDLNHRSGCSTSGMKSLLLGLQKVGLITFTPGQPGSAHRTASEISRVLPIPEPPPRR